MTPFPRFADEYIERLYNGHSAFDLWQLLTTIEVRTKLPQKSWLFCRVVEWMSSTRSGVWTYHEATEIGAQQAILSSLKSEPLLAELCPRYEIGMKSWSSEGALDEVDRWIDQHEGSVHESLMQNARSEMESITTLNKQEGGQASA